MLKIRLITSIIQENIPNLRDVSWPLGGANEDYFMDFGHIKWYWQWHL